jgi:peptidyl-prolyl cis-trans isomerase SurA
VKQTTLSRLPGCAADGTLPARRARWWWLLIAAALAGSAPVAGDAGDPLYIDGVVAQVGEEIVLASEVEEQLAILQLRQEIPDSSLVQARDEILNRIIDEKVIVQEARSRGINATFDEVEDAVQRHMAMIRDQMGGEEAFQRQLVQEGVAYEELLERYREEARRELLYTRLIQREIYSKIEISDAEVQRYFDEHRAELPPKPARVEIAHVFIGLRPQEEDLKAAQAKLEQIGRRMAAGESFESVAREFSQDEASRERGGDLGWFKPDELDPRLAAVVADLEPGAISDPVQTPQGVEILRVAERDSARVHLQHIRLNLRVSEDARAMARTRAEEVHRQAVAGTDFAILVEMYTDDRDSKAEGGNLGFFSETELTPNIANAVKGLKPGEVTAVVASDPGFHVFKLLARDGGGEWTFEETKERLRNRMVEERAQSLTDGWLTEVRGRYFIRRADRRSSSASGAVVGAVDSAPIPVSERAAP